MKRILLGAALIALTACSGNEAATTVDETTTDLAVVEATAPPASSTRPAPNPTRNVYFGETHVHTKNSFDAYIFNVRSTLDDVYDFAKGKPLTHPGGFEMRLDGPPLDFAAATDHGAYMGIIPALNDPDNSLSELEIAKGLFGTDPDVIVNAFQKIGTSVRTGEPFE